MSKPRPLSELPKEQVERWKKKYMPLLAGSPVSVFICYETTTGLNFAVNLRESLRKMNIFGFVADKDLPKGEDWTEEIDKVIAKSTYFVPIITIVALGSDEVRREIKLASELHRVIIPCRYREVDRKLMSRLPVVGELQQIDFEKEEELANKLIMDILKRESIKGYEKYGDIRSFRDFAMKEVIDKIRKGLISEHSLLGFNFPEEDLRGLNFERFVLMGSSFRGSILDNANFMDAALMGADFTLSSLNDTNMIGASCMGTIFDNASMNKVDLRKASLMGAYLRSSKLLKADLRDAALMGAKMEGADLRGSKLDGTIFSEALLSKTDLRRAKVKNTDFTKADLEGADFRDVVFDENTLKTIANSYNWQNAQFDSIIKEKIRKFVTKEPRIEQSLHDTTKVKALMVKCKTCGIWFNSGFAMSKQSFSTTSLKSNLHQCPKGHKHAYSKEDYRFRD